MAKERVQVQGLGRQTPSIRPTIQGVGSFNIATPTAPRPPVPQSNKLIDLANTLKASQGLLQQYGLAAKQEAEIFEDELSRKSPEEIQAMLKKTEGELDKQVRRGAMGWLTSPLNQKRKLRAVGQASSRLMMEQVYNRLENPEAGDEDLSTREVINLVQQQFVGDNEALSGSMFAQEGLQESVNPQILPLVRQYDAQKSRLAKNETSYGTSSVLYDQAESIGSIGEFDAASSDSIIKAWDNLSSFSVDEQRDIIGGVIRKLASNKLQDEAEDLLDFAKRNLKFGAADMSDMDYETFSEEIEILAERAEKREDADRVELVKSEAGNAFKALLDIRNPNITSTTFDGKSIKTEQELISAVQASSAFADDPEGLRNFVKTFESDRVQLRDPIEYLTQAAYQQVENDIGTFIQQVEKEFSTGPISAALAANKDVFTEFANNLIIDVYNESERLATESSDSDPFKLKLKLSGFIRDRGRQSKQQLRADLRGWQVNKDNQAPPLKTEGGAEEASTPNWIFPETLGGTQGKIQNDLSVLSSVADLPKEKALAYRNIINVSDESLEETINEIVGRKPKVAESFSFGNVPALGIAPRVVKAEQWTESEVRAKEILVAGVLNERGALLDIQALKRNSVRGMPIDPKRLDSTQHLLITEGEIEEVEGLTNEEIKRRKSDPMVRNIIEVAALMDVTDFTNFVIDQKNLYQRRKKIKGFKTLERK